VAGTVKKYGNIFIWDVTITLAAATGSATSDDAFYGRVVKIELDPTTMTNNATIKGYEANTALATGTRDHFINYTSASYGEVVFYPCIDGSAGVGGAALTTKVSQSPVVCDQLKIDIAAATAADVIRIRVYVESI